MLIGQFELNSVLKKPNRIPKAISGCAGSNLIVTKRFGRGFNLSFSQKNWKHLLEGTENTFMIKTQDLRKDTFLKTQCTSK